MKKLVLLFLIAFSFMAKAQIAGPYTGYLWNGTPPLFGTSNYILVYDPVTKKTGYRLASSLTGSATGLQAVLTAGNTSTLPINLDNGVKGLKFENSGMTYYDYGVGFTTELLFKQPLTKTRLYFPALMQNDTLVTKSMISDEIATALENQPDDKDNITTVKYFRAYSCSRVEAVLDSINALPPYEVSGKESVMFIGVDYNYDDCYYGAPPIYKYKLTNNGKGMYGAGQTQITIADLQLIEKGRANANDILSLPNTVFLDFGVNMTTSVYDSINNATTPFVFDSPYQTGHFTVVQGSDEGGSNRYYYLVAYGGEYSENANIADQYSMPQLSVYMPDTYTPLKDVSITVSGSDQDYSYVQTYNSGTSNPQFDIRLLEKPVGLLWNNNFPNRWYLAGEPLDRHATGQDAVDLTTTESGQEGIVGATGFKSFAAGFNTLASGTHTTALGSFNKATASYSTILGFENETTIDAQQAVLIGAKLRAFSRGEVAFGVMNTEYVADGTNNDRAFSVGIGNILGVDRKDGLTIQKNGYVRAPSLETWMIDNGDDYSLLTKGWFYENYTVPTLTNIIMATPTANVSQNLNIQSASLGNYANLNLTGSEGTIGLDANATAFLAAGENDVFVNSTGFHIRTTNRSIGINSDNLTEDRTFQFPDIITPSAIVVANKDNKDIEITDATKGVILRSPDGSKYRITVANGGALTTTLVP